MKTLGYDTLKEQNNTSYLNTTGKERILQFGEGNFLRAFVDYFVDEMNELADFDTKVVLCQPIPQGQVVKDMINEQEGLYTLYLRGIENGERVNKKRIISSVSRCINPYDEYDVYMQCAENPDMRFIASNTTEAGIVYDPSCKLEDKPASSFPGKLTQFLHKRYEFFNGDVEKGFIILSCELIDNNGKELEKAVLAYAKQWELGDDFIKWVQGSNVFCSTLVDRIVTGYPRSEAKSLNEENGYIDNVIDTGEVFAFWVIEGPAWIQNELPVKKAGLPILITDNHKPYKERKVRILNGAHTSFVLGAYLTGQEIVRNCMEDEVIQSFMNKTIYDEIIPTLSLPREETTEFAASVTERFKNPYIDHELLAIALNSTSKWRARVQPSLEKYVELNEEIPKCIAASFAFYIGFYNGSELSQEGLTAYRDGKPYVIKDDAEVLEFFYARKDADAATLVHDVCVNTSFWGKDLSQIVGFEEMVLKCFVRLKEQGAYRVMEETIAE